MKRSIIPYFAITLLVFLTPGISAGDIVILEGEETFSGNVLKITQNTLVFHTSLSGQMMVPMERVTALSTERNMVVTFMDKSVKYGRFDRQGNKAYLAPLDGRSVHRIELAQVVEALPIPPSRKSKEQTALRNTTGKSDIRRWASVGGYWANYEDTSSDGILKLGLSSSAKQVAYSGELQLARSGTDDFPYLLSAWLDLAWNGDGTLNPFVSLEVERNKDAAMDGRAEIALGVHTLLIDSLEARAGVGYAYEDRAHSGKYYDRLFEDNHYTGDEMNVRLSLRYSSDLFQTSQLNSEMRLLPSLSHLGEFRFRSSTSILYPVNDQLKLRLDMLFDYESHPPLTQLDQWGSRIGASVQVDF